MCIRVLLEKTLPLQCNPNVSFWNLAFFDKTMSQDSGNFPSKEIQDPIVDPFSTDTEFVDPVPQQISFRPPQFMAQFS
jgi:hypothetical protein